MNAPRSTSKPVVLVPSCNRMLGQHPFHIAGRKYIEAVRLAGGLPLIVPVAHADELDELLDLAHGVLLTGSPSNVHPRHFGEDVRDTSLPLDTERDDWTLPMIPRILERGIPLFAICRGFQEANVALGGSLHQAVHEVEGRHDHRGAGGRADASAEEMYDFALRNVDFIQRHVFPGSFIPSVAALTSSFATTTDLRLVNLEDIGPHYARTLREWRLRFLAQADAVSTLGYPPEFLRLWEFYLAYCEGGFAERVLGDVQMLLFKPRRAEEPWLPQLERR